MGMCRREAPRPGFQHHARGITFTLMIGTRKAGAEFKRQGNNPNKYPQQVAVGNALKQVGQQYKVVFTLAQFKATVIAHLEPLPLTTQAPAVSVDLTQEQDKVEVQLSDDESEVCPDQRFVGSLRLRPRATDRPPGRSGSG